MEQDNQLISKKEFIKLKVVVYFGYNGTKFQGSQIQKDTQNTVEYDLEMALHQSGFISQSNHQNMKKVDWNRASRTDKGVHALCNSVSLKIQIDKTKYFQDYLGSREKGEIKEDIDYGKLVSVVNSNLNNKQLKVFDIKSVTRGFNVKSYASDRLYEYLAPISMFTDQKRLEYEPAKQIVDQIDQIFQNYKGTNKYHNFTVKMTPQEEQAKRHMYNLGVKLYRISDLMNEQQLMDYETESINDNQWWVLFQLNGQSFMYHQIRKMIGLTSQVMIQKDMDYFHTCLSDTIDKNVWLAPADGLYLNRIFFKGYNRKHDIKIQLDVDQSREQYVDQFRNEVILPEIIGREFIDKRYSEWKDVVTNKLFENQKEDQQ